jgi:2-(1,2-epoxy-1,2-dihydrophenyl)acetyl-CoA isomerase
MNYKYILFEIKAGIASIILNRTERLNALTVPMVKEILSALDKCKEDSSVRVVVISGAGRAFCAGADVEVEKDKDPSEITGEIIRVLNKTVLKIRTLEKPVIASTRGFTSGAAVSIVLACDLAISSENCKFNLAFIKIGITPDAGASYFLPQLIGLKKTSMLFFTGDMISAEQAESFGFVNMLVPDEKLEEETGELASRMASGPTLAIGRTKKLMNDGYNNSLEQHLENEFETQMLSARTQDKIEGIKAFMEKRPPNFQGK